MLKKIKNLITPVTLALAMCASGASFAQVPNVNDPPKPKTQDPNQPNVNDPANKTAEERQRERQAERQRERDAAEKNNQNNNGKNEIELPASFYKTSELIGMRVDAKGGEKIGDIKNVAINTENGRTRYAIVDNGSGTLYPIPFPALKFAANRQRAVVDTTIDRMKDAATFKPDGWNTIGDNNWGKIVYEFYGLQRDSGNDKDRPDFVPANAVVGSKVETRKGDGMGTIKDVMIDTEKGDVAYVVLQSGNNNRLFAVPWAATTVSDNGKRVVVRGLDRDDLKDAPGFSNNRWPARKDLGWKNDTNFDSRPPNWVYGLKGDRNNNNNNDDDSDDDDRNNNNNGDRGDLGGWQTNGKYGQMFRPRAVERLSGTIVRTESVTPLNGMDKGTALVVRTEDQGNVIVHLGPEWFIKRQQGQFTDGVRVDVVGSQVEIDQKRVIMATQIRLDDRTLTLRNADGVPAWDAWQERK